MPLQACCHIPSTSLTISLSKAPNDFHRIGFGHKRIWADLIYLYINRYVMEVKPRDDSFCVHECRYHTSSYDFLMKVPEMLRGPIVYIRDGLMMSFFHSESIVKTVFLSCIMHYYFLLFSLPSLYSQPSSWGIDKGK